MCGTLSSIYRFPRFSFATRIISLIFLQVPSKAITEEATVCVAALAEQLVIESLYSAGDWCTNESLFCVAPRHIKKAIQTDLVLTRELKGRHLIYLIGI